MGVARNSILDKLTRVYNCGHKPVRYRRHGWTHPLSRNSVLDKLTRVYHSWIHPLSTERYSAQANACLRLWPQTFYILQAVSVAHVPKKHRTPVDQRYYSICSVVSQSGRTFAGECQESLLGAGPDGWRQLNCRLRRWRCGDGAAPVGRRCRSARPSGWVAVV